MLCPTRVTLRLTLNRYACREIMQRKSEHCTKCRAAIVNMDLGGGVVGRIVVTIMMWLPDDASRRC